MVARIAIHNNIGGALAPLVFPAEQQNNVVAHQFWNISQGTERGTGHWASGPYPDDKGEFSYVATLVALSEEVGLLHTADPRLYNRNPVKAPEVQPKQSP